MRRADGVRAEGTAAARPPTRVDLTGFALVIASALCYSSLGIFGKVALGEGMSVPSLLATRFVLATAIVWACILPSPRLRTATFSGRPWAVAICGSVGLAGQSALFFTSLRFVSASLAEVLLYTCPAFLAILVWIRSGRRPEGAVLASILLALTGTWLAADPSGGRVSAGGAAMALATGLWYAVFLLALERVTPGVPTLVSTAWVLLGTSAAFAAAAPFLGGYRPPGSPAAWGAVAGLVVGPTLLGLGLFLAGLRRVGPQVTSVLSTFEPVGTLVLAALLLGERLRAGQWAGAVLILVAAFVLAARRPAAH